MVHVSASVIHSRDGNRTRGRSAGDGEILDITEEARRLPAYHGHEQVLEFRADRFGLRAFIAIHDTTLGPALGGCRAVPYAARAEALTDALRLSRGMTYKAAVAGLDLGGGKAVIPMPPDVALSEAFCQAFGCAIEALGGRYITGEDAGTSVREMDWINAATDRVIGSSARGGDPSPMTALGVHAGIRAAARHRLGSDDLAGVVVAVQGLGHVGQALCDRLAADGARLIVADIDPGRVEATVARLGAKAVPPEEIHRARADVFAPCALGATLNPATVPELDCAVVAGSANNQLARAADGLALQQRRILYAPDYVVNAGGLISAAVGLGGEAAGGPVARRRVEGIGAVLATIFERAATEGAAPEAIADRLAEERLRAGRPHAGISEGERR
jgi:leucine dehydrogenase